MTNRFRKLVAWTLLAQVMLVGGLGTGLHGLLGCEHGPGGGCNAACCVSPAASSVPSGCKDCVFCRRVSEQRSASFLAAAATVERGRSSVASAGCDGCAVCDLLAQYHHVTPFEFEPLAIELALGEAALQRHNGVVAASIRLALSRGPPAV